LKNIASKRRQTLSELVGSIDTERKLGNLSSALRLFVLNHYQESMLSECTAHSFPAFPGFAFPFGTVFGGGVNGNGGIGGGCQKGSSKLTLVLCPARMIERLTIGDFFMGLSSSRCFMDRHQRQAEPVILYSNRLATEKQKGGESRPLAVAG
jgi:hypothetical protein